MSKADELNREDEAGKAQEDDKLVPVSEAIKYRKRAQAAEQERAELDAKLREMVANKTKVEQDLAEIKCDHELSRKLSAAGAIDLEAAVLMAKSKLAEDESGDVESVVESMRREKSYLFGGVGGVEKTAGVREKAGGGRGNLENLAKRAVKSGRRSDVQEYLRERRKFV
ncbi:hypothetical protein STSP2_00258 [Anaerohalosphaera lusitana]|uniref:Phage minor structural protein GP20 n=1 Tax=Anaerohalosphaera lusitana TaxID=1936003 RepID=A0A1U9NH71_9BACT|nr:hypothetical protein [Anaerohalosphaera lusitana]AQT67117.1 hypothetical protein STSP2_00258 [Anaerohalosphaera lusitana]